MESGNHNSQFSTLNSQLSEFDEIRPYEPEEMKQAFEDLLNDRQFNVLMKGFAPWLPKGVRNGLLRLALTIQLFGGTVARWHGGTRIPLPQTFLAPPYPRTPAPPNVLRSSRTIVTSCSTLPSWI